MVLSDNEIANSVQMKPITEIAAELGGLERHFALRKIQAKVITSAGTAGQGR